MLQHNPDITASVIYGLGWFYLLLFLMNCLWVKRSYNVDKPVRLGGQDVPVAGFWALYTALLGMVSIAHLTGSNSPEQFLIRLPESFKNFVDYYFANPIAFFIGSVTIFLLMIWLRAWWTRPTIAWILLNLALLFLGLSMTDYDFRQIVGKPDNVPIVSMLFIVAFFTWIYFSRSVDNDRRRAEGRPLYEVEKQEKV